MEQESKKRRGRAKVQKIILASIALAGILPVAMVAPNVVGAMGRLGMLPSNRENEIIKRSRERLLRRGLISYQGRFLRLTAKGKESLRMLELREFKNQSPQDWDGRWRVLIFDIPEKRRVIRNKIRRTLVQMGFARLQDSVWLYPYDCEDVITLLKADLRIGRDVLYLIVDTLEYEAPFRKIFKLDV